MTTPKIGIATYEEMKARTLAIARGDLTPKAEDLKVWSTSANELEWLEAELLKGLTGPETPLDLAEVKAEGLRLLAARLAARGALHLCSAQCEPIAMNKQDEELRKEPFVKD